MNIEEINAREVIRQAKAAASAIRAIEKAVAAIDAISADGSNAFGIDTHGMGSSVFAITDEINAIAGSDQVKAAKRVVRHHNARRRARQRNGGIAQWSAS